MLTPASARSRAISPIAPGLSWRSTSTASRSSAMSIPASSSAWRAFSSSSTRMWMKPLPSPTIAQRPSMFTPARPVASPRSASLPGLSSTITVRSFIEYLRSIRRRCLWPPLIRGPPHHMQTARVKRGVPGRLEVMANRLADETSPYLLQHKDNPVDWRPWGPEALAEAAEQDKPILLSIGYSACHWCHVMERESFEDEEIAAYMNEHFVPVKVDREERPDLDAIYMEACQAMTGQGGWPLNVFLTPEQVPFYAGTYFPPDSRMGMPSWRSVLEAVAKAWDERRDEIREGGTRIAERLRGGALLQPSENDLDERTLDDAVEALRGQYARAHGGFGGAPKFPPASAIEFLLRRGETEMTSGTLRAMASGGMYDQVGGGFARYSVDPYWLVPHFEKMLYDNALPPRAHLHGWQGLGGGRTRR